MSSFKGQPIESQGNKEGQDPDKFGLKYDSEKTRWDLVPFDIIRYLFEKFNSINDLKIFIEMNIKERIDFIIEKFISGSDNEYVAILLMQVCKHVFYKTFPYEEIEKVAEIYTYGAKKYADNNWQKVDPDRYVSAFMRHMMALRLGKIYDEESGFEHRHHALWNIITLIWFEKHATEKN